MNSLPAFAIVGHPNKGKSCIVATLAEDDGVRISERPGTTRKARAYSMRLDGEELYQLIDTPGFQRPREVLEWLQQGDADAHSRSMRVRQFVQQHQGDERFRDECELLAPIIAGAGILYVVDGARPYGSEYEAEMEILRWTGQPRMALINPIGSDTHVSTWQRALDQYFSMVRVFDPLHADFARRIELLEGFSALDASWNIDLKKAVNALEMERARRKNLTAQEIAALLEDTLVQRESALLDRSADKDSKAVIETREVELHLRLLEKLKKALRRRERTAWRQIRDFYHHGDLHAGILHDLNLDQLSADLFSERTFTLFGLSRLQLLMSGAASGAVAGGGIDLIVGGASMLLGCGIGALIGGAGVLFGAQQLARVEVMGMSLGGYQLVVGPIAQRNFPWVVLGRSILYFRLISERNHARREALEIEADAGEHLADQLPNSVRKRLQTYFDRILRDGRLSDDERRALISELEQQL